jgi:hypothetical protein
MPTRRADHGRVATPQQKGRVTIGRGAWLRLNSVSSKFPRRSCPRGPCSFRSVHRRLVFGPLIVLALDLILDDWLVDHLAFWNDLIGFYDSVL